MIRNRIQRPDGAWKMLKNESAQNPIKPIPLRLSRLPDSDGIFTLSNGLRMWKLLHSDRKPKQVKSQRSTGQKVNVDVSMTSACRLCRRWRGTLWLMVIGQVCWQGKHVAGNWTSQWLTSGINPSNGEMPRGPVMGSHVAPSHHSKWQVSKVLGSMGFEPMTNH